MKKLLIAGLLAASAATGAQAATVYGVDENNNLVRFDSANPSTFLSSVRISGLSESGSLQALDFRPSTRVLYGLSSDRILYTINLSTGAATQIGSALAIEGSQFGFDFNPSVDRIRVTSNLNNNYVVNQNTGAVQVEATDLAYAAGDPNAGRDPGVTANAYTFAMMGGANVHYAIDTDLDVLVNQANNAGTLTTIGALNRPPSDILGSRTSFDILGAAGSAQGFVQNGRNFYTVDLGTGQLSLVGRTDESLFGIAVAPVPEPAAWGLMILGVGAVGGSLRHRRRTAVRFANA